MVLLEKIALKLHSTFKLTSCYIPEDHKSTLVIKGNGQVAPKTLFQEDFIAIGQQVVKGKFKTIVLDQSVTEAMNSASLQWYCMVWKELMYFHGVTKHVFILTSRNKSHESVEQKSRTNFEGLIKNLKEGGIEIHSSLDEALATQVHR